MKEKPPPEWNPRSEVVLEDQIANYDQMRKRCPIAHSDYLHWSLFRHQDVVRALSDPKVFSNNVSKHLAVPNGMDPPEHTEYRRVIEPYFNSQRMTEFEPICRHIAANLLERLPRDRAIETMAEFADIFAIEAQCAFLEWPATLHQPLLQWTRRNHKATRSGDKAAMSAVALEFDGYIQELLDQGRVLGASASDDAVTRLLRERVKDRPLDDEEIVSVLRTWTVGELSTIAACVGILMHYLAGQPRLQQELREEPSLLPAAIDEILRIHSPFIASRRVITEQVEIGGCVFPPGERVTLMWASANRDEAEFGEPDEFRLDREPTKNLLYGAGVHVCPGAPLARLELRVLTEELLTRTSAIAFVPGNDPIRAAYPSSGFSFLPLRMQWTSE